VTSRGSLALAVYVVLEGEAGFEVDSVDAGFDSAAGFDSGAGLESFAGALASEEPESLASAGADPVSDSELLAA
jgi:hypothetical protein